MTATPELNKALAAFQAKLPRIGKGETGKVEGVTKQGKPYSYEYNYADLAGVSEVILPLIGEHGLAYTAEPCHEDGRLVLDYALLHSSGEERAKQFPLWLFVPERATAQTIGGLVTYFRRYCLLAVTGVAPGGEDDDAAAASTERPAAAVQGAPQRPAANAGVGYIMAQFNRLQVTDPGVQLGYAADLTGHAVNRLDELTTEEQRDLFTKLKGAANPAALEQLRKQEAMA